MSIFWDPRKKKPQIWVGPFFILLTIAICFGIYQYGFNKAKRIEQNNASLEKM